MKKILIVHPSSDLYGSDKILINILKNMHNINYTLIIPKNGPLIDILKKEFPNIQLFIYRQLPIIARKNFGIIGIFNFIISMIKFKIFLKKKNLTNPDILYCNTLATTPISLFFHKTYKIIHVHEILNNKSIIHKIINKTATKLYQQIICVSQAVNNNLKEVASFSEKNKLITIHNGISFKDSKLITTQNFEVDKSKINFALIGRIKPEQKGQILFINAIAQLPKNLLDKAHFYLIGSTVQGQEYMLDEVQKTIQHLKLENTIEIIPFIKNIETVYKAIDVSVVPSLIEDSFPTTVLESMYFGKPVIGTKIGGIPEMIINDVTGFTFPVNDTIKLTKYITFFIQNPQQISIMGAEGKNTYQNKFSIEIFNQKFTKLLYNLIN